MSTRLCPVCQTPLPSDAPLDLCPRCLMDMPLPPPGADGATPLIREGARVIGDYELRQEIGQGGMGTVYRAYQRSLKRVVALKTINPSRGSGNTDFLRRFRIEAEAIAALKHDNIVEIHEAGEHEGQSYFSMEFIEGGDLRQEIEAQGGRPIPLQRAVKLVAAIARAVHHAHERGVLHRDLKPANILLDSKDKPYVSDFGLARLFRDQFEASAAPPSGPQPALSVLTEVGQGMGSPGYTSSEQAEGRLDELTTASDVFSLGAILFHLITGQAPLPTKSWRNPEIWEEYVRFAKAGNFAKPSSLNRQIDADLESICLRCLKPDPKCRAHSADDLADQLDHWLLHEPLDPEWRRSPVWERAGKWVRRHRTATALIASLLLVAALVYSLEHIRRHSMRQQSLARERKLFDDLEKADGAFLSGDSRGGLKLLAQILDKSPDNRVAAEWLANVLRQHAFLIPIGTATRTNRIADIQHDFRIARSSDGTSKVSASEDTLKLEEPPSGERSFPQVHTGVVRSVAFSPDDRLLVSASDDGNAVVWDVATASIRAILRNHAAIRYAEFSPDGLYIIAACSDGNARLWDLKSTQLEAGVFPGDSSLATARFSSNGQWIVTASEARGVHIWDLATRRLVAEPLLLPSTLDARFDADDRTVIVETRGGELRSFRLTRTVPLCAAQTDEIPKRTPPLPVADIVGIAATNFHADDITSFQFSPDGKLLATASKDNTACLWEMRPLQPSNGPFHRLKHSETVNCVRFAPNGERIVTSTAERKVRVWDTRTGLPLTDWLVFNDRVAVVEFSADGRRIITDMGWSWELHLTSGPAPEWLRLLAGAIADSSETSAAQGLLTLRRELPRRPDAEAGWAKRLLEVQ